MPVAMRMQARLVLACLRGRWSLLTQQLSATTNGPYAGTAQGWAGTLRDRWPGGVEVCHSLRHFSAACVLMLAARGGEIGKVVGLSVAIGWRGRLPT
ncbi:MAG: hypothetical protein IVW55_00195 [Chloroflexi bacterium]|nr:hypothetical protein [Chloroflexota bacterium]